MTQQSVGTLDLNALNAAIRPMVQAMFWGAVLAAVAVPIAAAIGGVVAEKVLPKGKKK